MFRVPADPSAPTFDHVFKVGFFRWLTSKKDERNEWLRRRNVAAQTARANQNQKIDAWAERRRREADERRRPGEHR